MSLSKWSLRVILESSYMFSTWFIMLTLSVSFKAQKWNKGCDAVGPVSRHTAGDHLWQELCVAVPRSRAARQSRWLQAQVRGEAGGEPSSRGAGEVTMLLTDGRMLEWTVSPFETGTLALELEWLCLGFLSKQPTEESGPALESGSRQISSDFRPGDGGAAESQGVWETGEDPGRQSRC